MSTRKKKVLAGAAGLIALVVVAGTAYALWSARGTGTGRAQASEAVTAELSPADGDSDLYPGATDGDVSFTIENDNPYPIQFTSMDPGPVTSSTPGCGASYVTVQPADDLSLVVGAESSTETLTIEDVVSMSIDAPDACQNAVFGIELTLQGSQTSG